MQSRTDADSSMNDVDLRVKDRSFGLMMPAKVRTMRDYEQQLNVLRKENLHLRLRMFFLEQGKGRHCSVSTGGEYEAFVQQVQNDMKTLVNEVDKRNALIQKNWVTIEQQHEAIEKLTEEKLAAEKELFTLQTKALLAEGANKDHQKMANMISELEQQKKQLEQDMKALRKRLGELEERDIPGMRKEIDKRNIAIQGLTVQVVKKDKAIAKLESQMSVLSSTQPLTDTFLERLDRSLASSDVDSAVAARDQFRHDFSFITNRKKNSSDASPVSSVAMSALKEQVCSLEAELKMKEAAIESMDTEMSRLKSALRASQEQCGDLEGEMERSTQVHMRICAEKDKLLETLQNRVHQLQENVQEVQTLKTRQSALERECNSLHAALHEKDNFIEELLTERNRAAFDTEKSFQELIHSMRQKDEHIEVLQTKLNGADVEAHYSAIASPSECSLLDPTTLKSPHHQEDPKEAGSFNLIELSAGEASIQKPQDSAKPDTESLDALDRGSSSKLLPIDRDLIEELSEFYEILCKASQDAEVLPEVKAPTVPQAECSSELRLNFVRELKSTLQHVCERGFALVTRSEDGLCESSGSTVATRGGTDNKIRNLQICGGDQLDPAVSEKLQEILTVLSIEPTAESSSGWHVRDLLAHLDSFLQKIRSNGSELSQSHAVQEKEMAQLRENKVLRERLLDSIAAITKVKSSEQGVGTEFSDLKEEILRELAPVLECVNFLHGEVDTMSVSTGEKQDRCDKKSASIEELVYMVDESGRLVPVPESAVPSPEPGACREAVHAKDVGQQTEDAAAAEELEQLRNELNKSRAQVKFLQKSLKESFSVRMTDSNKPLIEIDQNRPVPEGSPNKSANRRWRKQLTNQKMSEFGLSENVFELQEEIFFLVLRIEDLERQLGRGTSAVPHEHSEKSQAPPAAEPKAKALQARCEALEQQVQDMQEASTVLLCRLEELAAFLEQLLQFDESGAFGSISLPPDTVARMRQLVADSRDFSLSVSQSILGGSDTGSILSEHSVFKASAQKELQSSAPAKVESVSEKKTTKKFDPKDIPPQDEDVVFMEEELARLRDQVEQQQEEIFELSKRLNKDTSGASHAPNTSEGRSKKTPQSARCQLRRLEKLLRRMQGCSAKLEDVLTSHKELCQKMLDYGNSDTSRESVEQVQLPSSELIDAHIQTMRKLQFKLEETVINNELLREILTERVESGSIIKTEMVSTSASSPEAEAAQKLQQYSKELECKERREEILKRAIANEQAAKLQLEKELLESHKELQTLHDAHSKLEESFKQYGTMPSTGFDTHLQATLREVQDWNLRLQKENEEKSHRACELEAVLKKLQAQYAELTADLQEKNIQLEFATKEVENLKGSGSHNETDELKAMLKDRVNEIEEISCTVRALHEEINHLRSEKMMLSHKLEATHRDHEVLLESSSNKISELVMKLGPLSVQNKNQLDEIRSLKEANAALQAKLDIAVSKLDALHEELEGLDLVEADHSGLNLSTNQEIPLQDKLQQVVREVQLLRKATEESRCSEAALKEETENLSTKVLRLTTQVEELEAEAEELRADQQQLEAECREAQEKEWNATKRAEEFEQMAEELKRELQGTRSKLEEMDTRCARLEKELSCSNETQQQLVSTNRELQMLLESKSDQLRAVEVSNRDLQQTLIQQGANRGLERKHVMAFQELEDQNRSLQSQVMDLRAKVDQVCHHSRLSSLEKSLHDHMHSRSLLGRYSRSPPRSSHELDGHQAHSNAPSIQEGGSLCQSRSHHTSPDLGIDSDPTPEREDGNESAPIAGGFEEHWQHRMGANWSVTSVQSAPEAVGACPLCQQQGAPENSAKGRLNWTFAGEALDHLVDESPSKNIFPSICSAPSMTGMRMCAVVELMDHELLKKRVDESICLVRRLEGTVQQLLDVLMELAPQFDEASNSKGLLQDALTGCRSIRICLVESFRLICSFTISPIPDAKDECHQRCCYENKQLKDELTSLSEKHSKQSTELQNALDQISTFKEKKEGMERAISRQLNKTKMVLKQTRGNLNVLRNKDPKPEKK
ncbi:golgin subfamily A member 4-like isoform X2 [Ornithodoros turicata]|uniref:golgin subfamily A member 4-like isoform X2 n=1 Tax=Ornithodoros turicata TaxID=34597 RepID=UPI0031392C1D